MHGSSLAGLATYKRTLLLQRARESRAQRATHLGRQWAADSTESYNYVQYYPHFDLVAELRLRSRWSPRPSRLRMDRPRVQFHPRPSWSRRTKHLQQQRSQTLQPRLRRLRRLRLQMRQRPNTLTTTTPTTWLITKTLWLRLSPTTESPVLHRGCGSILQPIIAFYAMIGITPVQRF